MYNKYFHIRKDYLLNSIVDKKSLKIDILHIQKVKEDTETGNAYFLYHTLAQMVKLCDCVKSLILSQFKILKPQH